MLDEAVQKAEPGTLMLTPLAILGLRSLYFTLAGMIGMSFDKGWLSCPSSGEYPRSFR